MSSKLEALVSLPQKAPREAIEETNAAGVEAAILVGEVTEAAGPGLKGQVRICWQAVDGSKEERPLSFLKGLALQEGDRVLLRRPANWPEWLVTDVISPSNAP